MYLFQEAYFPPVNFVWQVRARIKRRKKGNGGERWWGK
jgi:hypothetical protein